MIRTHHNIESIVLAIPVNKNIKIFITAYGNDEIVTHCCRFHILGRVGKYDSFIVLAALIKHSDGENRQGEKTAIAERRKRERSTTVARMSKNLEREGSTSPART